MSVMEEGDVARFLYVEREEVVGEVPVPDQDAMELVAEHEEQENYDYLDRNDNLVEEPRTRRRRQRTDNKENNPQRHPQVSSRPSPLCPFQTAKEFGIWLIENVGSRLFVQVHLQFFKYCSRFRIQSLVRFGRRKFSGVQRLFFLQGLRLVAVSMSQKMYVDKVLHAERGKLMQKLGPSRLANL